MKKQVDFEKQSHDIFNRMKIAYGIDDEGGLFLLESARESWIKLKQAEAVLNEYGVVIKDKFGQLKSNPAASVLRDNKAQMLQAFKLLNLEIKTLED